MQRIGIVGISWKQQRADALAALTIPKDERAGRLPALATALGTSELVYLATCNRVEVAFTIDSHVSLTDARRTMFAALSGRAPRTGEAEHALRVWQGEGAAEHLFLVAAGLDSARVGESEIVAQVREAFELSRSVQLTGVRLDRLFTEALKVAKRVRPVTERRVGKVSLSGIAVDHVLERLARTPGAVALIGVSPMTEQCATALAAHNVPMIVVNRTIERAADFAARVGASCRSLEDFRQSPDSVEALVIATGAREPILRRADLDRLAARSHSGQAPLILDLAIPANVAPEEAAAADVPRIGMDQISTEAAEDREALLLEFGDARAIVDEALTDFRRQSAERFIGPIIAQLQLRYRHTAVEGVERLFAKELAGLGEPEREAVRRWAETLARRFAHVPSVGLRDLAFAMGPGAIESFLGTTEPELARSVREAAEDANAGLAFTEEDDA